MCTYISIIASYHSCHKKFSEYFQSCIILVVVCIIIKCIFSKKMIAYFFGVISNSQILLGIWKMPRDGKSCSAAVSFKPNFFGIRDCGIYLQAQTQNYLKFPFCAISYSQKRLVRLSVRPSRFLHVWCVRRVSGVLDAA